MFPCFLAVLGNLSHSLACGTVSLVSDYISLWPLCVSPPPMRTPVLGHRAHHNPVRPPPTLMTSVKTLFPNQILF